MARTLRNTLIGLALAAALAIRAGRRVEVAGDSMRPNLEPGDRLLLVRAWRLRAGDLVGVRDPRAPERVLVKRVHAVGTGGVEVRGDNPDASTDSRHFGPLPREHVVGRAVYRYAPPGRTGLVPRRGDDLRG